MSYGILALLFGFYIVWDGLSYLSIRELSAPMSLLLCICGALMMILGIVCIALSQG